jgi:glucose-6-phosphate isomerase
MDKHFCEAPLEHNIPVILALLGILYRNLYNCSTYAILPYAESLETLPCYIQQLDMESNGKSISLNGKSLSYQTGPVIFGGTGTNVQHSFFQLLHQGTQIVPCDFISTIHPNCESKTHHTKLLANMLAQSKALMQGQTIEEAQEDPFRCFPGNRPSNTILLDRMDGFHLGMLIAMYEHKIFVQGTIWNINSFDQYGVELGKTMAKDVLRSLNDSKQAAEYDSSTNGLLNHLKTHMSI